MNIKSSKDDLAKKITDTVEVLRKHVVSNPTDPKDGKPPQFTSGDGKTVGSGDDSQKRGQLDSSGSGSSDSD